MAPSFTSMNQWPSLFSVSASDRLYGLHSGGLVFWLSTAAAVDTGQDNQEDKRGNKQDEHKEGSQLQRTGLWETLQLDPHLLKNIQHLLFHVLHDDSQIQVPQGDLMKRLCFQEGKRAFMELTQLNLCSECEQLHFENVTVSTC